MISDSHKFIFIDVPKTGSQSIRSVLKKYGGKGKHNRFTNEYTKNITNGKCEIINQNIYEDYFKFSIFRDPLDRLLSLYTWKRRRGKPPYCQMELNEWVEYIYNEWTNNNKIFLDRNLLPQEYWVLDHNKKNICDYIGFTENIDEAWDIIRKHLPFIKEKHLPHKNKGNIKDIYTDVSICLIKEMYYGLNY